MTSPPPPAKKRRLGEILLAAGLIDEMQLKAALSEQRKWGGRLGRTLVEMGFVDEAGMVAALSKQLNLPTVTQQHLMSLPEGIVNWLRVDIAERYGVFPLGGDSKHRLLHVATSDPANGDTLRELEFRTGMRVTWSVSGSSAIDRAIRRYYYGEQMPEEARPVAPPTPGPIPPISLTTNPHFDFQSSTGAPLTLSIPEPVVGAPEPDEAQTRPFAAEDLAVAGQIDELTQRMASLEQHVSQQVKVLRGLFELLLEKGVISREEYLAKIRRDG